MEKFPKKCSTTGKGIRTGFCLFHGENYFTNLECLKEFAKCNWIEWGDVLEELKSENRDWIYYSEWELEEDIYYDEEGKAYPCT